MHPAVLGSYRMAPLIVPHYTADAAVRQKVQALLTRRQPEARDVFDLYILSPQPEAQSLPLGDYFPEEEIQRAIDRIDSIEYERYRDTVVGFLSPEDQQLYDRSETWDRIRLMVIDMLEKRLPGKP